jgi:hypothetical protein
MAGDRFINNYTFWEKISNYSSIVCGIVLVTKMFFRKYLEELILPILLIGGIALIIFLISELMKFILRRNGNK